jgi:NAD+ synthase
MPEIDTSEEDIKDALSLSNELGVEYRVVDISNIVTAFTELLSPMEMDTKTLGNIKARCRMIALYIHANLENRLVMGTSNKSELATGYFTKFGDGGVDFSPIGDLYKSQVFELARAMGLPVDIIDKPPSAGLAAGQTDEGELGMSYETLDRILLGIELKMESKDISDKVGVKVAEVERIRGLVKRSVHKRKQPLIPKIGIRTFGLDWRE